LTALTLLSDYFKQKQMEDMVVVATDIGISKRARDMAARMNAPLAIVEKRRLGNAGKTEALNVIGDVKGKIAVTFDDEIDTAGSLTNTVIALLERGAKEVYSCATHPVFSDSAIERIAKCPVKQVVVADTVPVPPEKKLDKIVVLPMAPLLGEAIHRIHTGLSVGAMFEPE
jgi:ribose-phosphate pyrophosphokinase